MTRHFTRIEHRELRNPDSQHYRGPFTDCHPLGKRSDAWRMPLPFADGLGVPASRWVCGFSDGQCWEDWFSSSDRSLLREHGYVVRTYEVPAYAVRTGQVQAIADAAHLCTPLCEEPV
jgi:hypothetical protein